MRTLEFRLSGQVPSYQAETKRSKPIRRGNSFVTPTFMSKKYKDWQVQSQFQIDHESDFDGEEFERCTMEVTFLMDSNRRRDLDNHLKSLGDMLQEAGVLKDDCWQVVSPIILDAKVSKASPGVEIKITERPD